MWRCVGLWGRRGFGRTRSDRWYESDKSEWIEGGVRVLVVIDRFVHEQSPNRVAILSDRDEGGYLLVVCHRSWARSLVAAEYSRDE